MVTITDVFNSAMQHHKAGRLTNAKTLYEQVIAQQPQHSDALHLLGLIEHQLGKSRHCNSIDAESYRDQRCTRIPLQSW